MKLKEKLRTVVTKQLRSGEDHSEDLEHIADDFAIDFAEWLNTLEAKYLIGDLILIGELNKNPKTKELLTTFKKEKAL